MGYTKYKLLTENMIPCIIYYTDPKFRVPVLQ